MKRIVIFSIFCSILSATTWHISTTGSDETGDGSAGNPFAKIQHGIDASVDGDTVQDAGYRSVQWDATNMHGKPVSAGVYLYQIRAGEFVQTRKMVLLK